MPYLNVDPSYPEHPKIIRLKGALGEMADALPIRLWAYCARVHASDGIMRDCSPNEFESIIGWRGKPGLAVCAFLKFGLIERCRNGYACHDWKEHEGHLDALSRRARAAAKKRWSNIYKNKNEHVHSNA